MIDKSKKESINFLLFAFCFLLSIVLISGCAVKTNLPLEMAPTPGAVGIMHTVQRGETLWRISHVYNLDLDKIIQANRITDTTIIRPGQNIFIPGVKKDIPVPNYNDKSGFIWPVRGKIDTYFKSERGHLINKGVNIKAKFGADVLSSRSGVVSFCADNLAGYGKTIIIDHDDGFVTIYAYNSQNLVKANDRVTQGMAIAKVGLNERAGGAMLHFEIRKANKPQNPLYYLPLAK